MPLVPKTPESLSVASTFAITLPDTEFSETKTS